MQAEWLSRMTLHFACSFCPWTYDGLLAEGRIEHDNHRVTAHPDIPPYKRPRRLPGSQVRQSWRSEISDEDREDVEVARRRRANIHGVDLQDDQ